MKRNKNNERKEEGRKFRDTHFLMRKIDVAGWWRCDWQSDSGWLACLGAVEEVEEVLASGCLGEEAAEEVEVGVRPIPPWCHSQSCGAGCR